MRSGDEELRKELTLRYLHTKFTDLGGESSNSLHYPEFWSAQEFEPIGKALDNLFLRQGWISEKEAKMINWRGMDEPLTSTGGTQGVPRSQSEAPVAQPPETEEDLRAWEENLRKTNPKNWEIYQGLLELTQEMKYAVDKDGNWTSSVESTEPLTEAEKQSQDPEGWRQYADSIDEAQIAWLRCNPQYDTWDHVVRYDATRAAQNKVPDKPEE